MRTNPKLIIVDGRTTGGVVTALFGKALAAVSPFLPLFSCGEQEFRNFKTYNQTSCGSSSDSRHASNQNEISDPSAVCERCVTYRCGVTRHRCYPLGGKLRTSAPVAVGLQHSAVSALCTVVRQTSRLRIAKNDCNRLHASNPCNHIGHLLWMCASAYSIEWENHCQNAHLAVSVIFLASCD